MQPAVSEGWDNDERCMIYQYVIKFWNHYMVLLTTKQRGHEYPFSQEWVDLTTDINGQVFTARDLVRSTQSNPISSRT